MGEYKELTEVIIGAFSIIGSVWAAIRLLISHWAKKSEEIQKLKGSILNKEIELLQKEVEKHTKSLSLNNVKLTEAREELLKTNGRLEVISTKLDNSNEKLNDFSEETKRRILSIEYTFENGELVSVGKGAVMIRQRKTPPQG